jgi:serine/threonine protein kinase
MARDVLLDRRVAIKLLFPELTTEPAFVTFFQREAQVAANLNHPNIVGLYDWGQQDGRYFAVLEYVAGGSLAHVLQVEQTLPAARAVEIAARATAALGFAHRTGVVHQAVRSGNVLVADASDVKVTNFGIGHVGDLTDLQAGSAMEAAAYFSPEQAQGDSLDARSDLYSLGIVMYEMVGGRLPFSGENAVMIAYKQVHEDARPLSLIVPDVPSLYEGIVAKLLTKDPRDRYGSADALRDDLRRCLGGKEVRAAERPTGRSALTGQVGSTGQHGSSERAPVWTEAATSDAKTPSGSLFLSYSRRDVEQMRRVRTAVEDAGLDVWTDEHLQPGTPSWTKAIETAIDRASALVVLLSPDAKQSPWVETEVNYARTRGIPIYPVLVRGEDATAVPMILISYQYLDARTDLPGAMGLLIPRLDVR